MNQQLSFSTMDGASNSSPSTSELAVLQAFIVRAKKGIPIRDMISTLNFISNANDLINKLKSELEQQLKQAPQDMKLEEVLANVMDPRFLSAAEKFFERKESLATRVKAKAVQEALDDAAMAARRSSSRITKLSSVPSGPTVMEKSRSELGSGSSSGSSSGSGSRAGPGTGTGSGSKSRRGLSVSRATTPNNLPETQYFTEEELNADRIFLEFDFQSVGHRIKEAALNLQPKFNSSALNYCERRIFVLGMSSILDLVDQSATGQFMTVFPDKRDQDELRQQFAHLQLPNPTTNRPQSLPAEVLFHFDVCASRAQSEGIEAVQEYLDKRFQLCPREWRWTLKIIETVVDSLLIHPNVYNPVMKTSEQDVLSALWHPILTKLLAQMGVPISFAVGESVNPYSNRSKKDQYEDENSIAFKIDGRILYQRNGKVVDLLCMEMAKKIEMQKVADDGAKLMREAKDNVNVLTQALPPDNQQKWLNLTKTFGIQIAGTTGVLISEHIVAPGLYVAIRQAPLMLPTTIDRLGDFRNTFLWLHVIKDFVRDQARAIRYEYDQQNSMCSILDLPTEDTVPAQSAQGWTNSTFYTPPKNAKFKVLSDLCIPFPHERLAELADEERKGKRKALDVEEIAIDVGEGIEEVKMNGMWIFRDRASGCTTSTFNGRKAGDESSDQL